MRFNNFICRNYNSPAKAVKKINDWIETLQIECRWLIAWINVEDGRLPIITFAFIDHAYQ